MHVFGPFDRFPLAIEGAYTPPVADQAQHAALLDQLSFDHALVIQPSAYREDHSALLDALAKGRGRLLGIGSCTVSTSEEELSLLRKQGIAGLRFVGVTGPAGGAYPGTQGLDALHRLAPAMAKLGMHAHIWAEPEQCVDTALTMAAEGVPVVFDHCATLSPADTPGTLRFDRVVEVLNSGAAWVKLAYFRRSAKPGDYTDMRDTVAALASMAPDRVLWGSDWPFVRCDMPPDQALLLHQLRDWIGESGFRRCLSDNPRTLFGAHLDPR